MTRAPLWFKVVSILALLWNLMGVFAFVADASMGPDEIAKLSAAQQAMYAARPAWAPVATGIATIGGVVGCLGLLFRKRWALYALVASLLGVIAQDAAILGLPGGIAAIGMVPVVLQGIVLLIAVGLVLLARKAIAKSWIT